VTRSAIWRKSEEISERAPRPTGSYTKYWSKQMGGGEGSPESLPSGHNFRTAKIPNCGSSPLHTHAAATVAAGHRDGGRRRRRALIHVYSSPLPSSSLSLPLVLRPCCLCHRCHSRRRSRYRRHRCSSSNAAHTPPSHRTSTHKGLGGQVCRGARRMLTAIDVSTRGKGLRGPNGYQVECADNRTNATRFLRGAQPRPWAELIYL